MNGVDEDFEARLREHLREAADQAPPFTGLRKSPAPGRPASDGPARGTEPDTAAPGSRHHRWLAAAATVLVLAGAGGVWWAAQPPSASPGSGGGPGAASCAALLRFEGRTYLGLGETTRMPRTGPRVGAGTMPPCDDNSGPAAPAEHLAAYALPGVPTRAAVLTDDSVWIAQSLADRPKALRDLTRPLRCHGDATTTLTGELTGVFKNGTERGPNVRPPYTATVVATRGDGLPLDRYRSVTVRVRVTQGTAGADPAVVGAVLGRGRLLTVTTRCDGTAFVANALRLAR